MPQTAVPAVVYVVGYAVVIGILIVTLLEFAKDKK